jgi:uncharacterized membrane protein
VTSTIAGVGSLLFAWLMASARGTAIIGRWREEHGHGGKPKRGNRKTNGLIQICVAPGDTIPEETRIAVVYGADGFADAEVLETMSFGPERTFAQDPALALRVLADIALRALSPAVNDPTTAVQMLDAIDGLLRVLVRRDLAVEEINGPDGTPRLLLSLPSWEDYLSVALDEIISVGIDAVLVGRRVCRLLGELLELAPLKHWDPIEVRLESVRRRTQP